MVIIQENDKNILTLHQRQVESLSVEQLILIPPEINELLQELMIQACNLLFDYQ